MIKSLLKFHLPIEMCGHFLRPACSMNVRTLMDTPIPQEVEHGPYSLQGVVRHTPIPSP